VIALGRGGVAETVDNAVGRTYAEATADGLRGALDQWEADSCRFDPAEARRRAEALSLGVFRERLLGLIAEVAARGSTHPVPPAPHLSLK
jgi:hypothetical protein